MVFGAETTQRISGEAQRESIIVLQAEAELAKQVERTIRDYLINKGKLSESATKEEYEDAKQKLDQETIDRISENTKRLAKDLFLRMAEQQHDLDTLKNKNTLTGLANGRMANRTFELLRSYCQTAENPLPMAVVSLDLDGFKQINDTYGHNAGNEVLELVGKILKRIRATDLAIHFHGDEFGLVLTNLKPGKKLDLSQTVEKKVSTLISAIENVREITLKDGRTIPLSISASAGFKIVNYGDDTDFFTANEQSEIATHTSKSCKGVSTVKLGSSRVADADKTVEQFLMEKNIPPEEFEQSEDSGNFNRPINDLLTREAKKQERAVTPEIAAAAQSIMEKAIRDIKELLQQ